MSELPARAAPLAPALLLLLFAGWCGTFQGSASWPAGVCGQALLLAGACLGAGAVDDPLRLGPGGRWLVWAVLATLVASAWASPVPRAGRAGLALVPAFLLLPAAVASVLAEARRRDLAIAGCSVATAAVASWSLFVRPLEAGTRAAMPLGHHNLLAAFLVTSLPVACAGLARRGTARSLSAVALATGLLALLATRSWLGWLAGLATLLAIARALPRGRKLVGGAILLTCGLLLPRLVSMLRGTDLSAAARSVYARAGWNGIVDRPLLGWGPGSTPWTLAEHLRPLPGVNPPGEAVGTLHSSALEVAYEIGLPGALLVVAALLLFGFRRLGDRRLASEPGASVLADCGLLGLAAGGAMALGNSLLAIPAISVALAVAAGAALSSRTAPPRSRAKSAGVALYAIGAAAVLAGPALAERAYAAAIRAPSRAEAAAALAGAVQHDPTFPLYGARRAWAMSAPAPERAAAALQSAASARGVAALWLRAGGLALEARDFESARAAFARAMALDPLGGVAPFSLYLASGGEAIDCAARALAAEPRLLAAVQWRNALARRAAAIDRLASWPGLPEGFAADLARRAAAVRPGDGEQIDLGLQMDVTAAVSVSLHQFRRSPWPADLARIPLDREAVRRLSGFGPASTRASAAVEAFPSGRCAPPETSTFVD